jgi:hypothetical protein
VDLNPAKRYLIASGNISLRVAFRHNKFISSKISRALLLYMFVLTGSGRYRDP